MIVLSLFDGISCGRVALKRAGVKVEKYFASEVDKYAIEVSKKNHRDVTQVGDVLALTKKSLKCKIDLLIGGSPCQGFSFAGKQLNFDDPRSKLFFEFVRLLKELKPKYFLLENVPMKQEFQNVISDLLGVEPILINSNLVSAQNRKRLYWTNISFNGMPKDKGIVLKDIIESGFVDRNKSLTITSRVAGGFHPLTYLSKSIHQGVFKEKSQTILSTIYKENAKSMLKRKKYGLLVKIKDSLRKLTPVECERLQTLPDNYTLGVSDTQRYKMLGNAWTVDVIAHIFKGLK